MLNVKREKSYYTETVLAIRKWEAIEKSIVLRRTGDRLWWGLNRPITEWLRTTYATPRSSPSIVWTKNKNCRKQQRRRGLKNVGGAWSCNFPDRQMQISADIEEIMGAQNFNFAHKLFQNGGFQLQFLHFWTKRFSRDFLTAWFFFFGGGNSPCHDATGKSYVLRVFVSSTPAELCFNFQTNLQRLKTNWLEICTTPASKNRSGWPSSRR